MVSKLNVGDKIKLNRHYPLSEDHWRQYPFPPIGAEGVIVKVYPGGWQDCKFDGYPDGLDDHWYIHTDWIEGCENKQPAPTDDLAHLQAENKRLRDALKTVLRKANSLAGYYPEPGDERETYGMDAPLVFDDIRKAARVALEGGE